jgi:hypothetical protein
LQVSEPSLITNSKTILRVTPIKELASRVNGTITLADGKIMSEIKQELDTTQLP